MKTRRVFAAALAVLVASGLGVAVGLAQEAQVDRTELPVKAPWYPPITTLDARDAKAPPVFEVKAPKDAPNVVVILLDDLGFGGTSATGSVMQTPHFDKLASQGLLYNQFHTTALCSPTRQALKTGRNHHSANQAKITEVATSFPGATGMLPNDVAGIGEMLRLNGYSTAAFGKWHETAVWEISPSGPFARWPNLQGFDEFYGFLGGETNQWAPGLFHNQNRVETPDDPDYHFMNDMATKSIEWIRFQQALTPDKPFFVYFAPGAVHAPHHVPKSYIDKQKGQFDEGWDVIRERIFEQQKKLGVIPKDTKLAKKPDDIKDWKDLSDKEKKLFARQAEVFAAYLDMTDHETGRVIQAIEDMGELDNTLIFYIAGDNGTSAEGVMNGLYNEMTYFNNEPKGSDIDFMLKHYDNWGDPTTYPHMAAGWAVCFDSPFTWTKQVASNYGGTRNALVVHWPDRIKGKGEMRSQWHHVIDVVPTILEAAGAAAAADRQRRAAAPHRGREHGLHLGLSQRPRPAPDPVLRDVRQPRHLLRRLVRRDRARQAVGQGREPVPRGHLGAVPREGRLQHVHGPREAAPGHPGRSCRRSSSARRSSTRCCPSTTGGRSCSIPSWPGGPT